MASYVYLEKLESARVSVRQGSYRINADGSFQETMDHSFAKLALTASSCIIIKPFWPCSQTLLAPSANVRFCRTINNTTSLAAEPVQGTASSAFNSIALGTQDNSSLTGNENFTDVHSSVPAWPLGGLQACAVNGTTAAFN